jgi:hypothetical protein
MIKQYDVALASLCISLSPFLEQNFFVGDTNSVLGYFIFLLQYIKTIISLS